MILILTISLNYIYYFVGETLFMKRIVNLFYILFLLKFRECNFHMILTFE